MPTVMLPSSLRRYTGDKAKVSASAVNVRSLLDFICEQSPELRNYLFDGAALRKFVVLFRNGKDIRQIDGLGTPLRDEDEVQIIASVAGG